MSQIDPVSDQRDTTPRDDVERNIVHNGIVAGFSDRTIDALIRKHREQRAASDEERADA